MTTPIFPSIIDDQVAEVAQAVPDDRILMVFKGLTMEDAKAETLVVAYFSLLAIDSNEFKHYCERIRRIAERRKEAA